MRIKILTSSRADFGILLPLLNKLFRDDFFQPELIVFGAHLSHRYGYTLQEIESHGFYIYDKVDSLIEGDTPQALADSMGVTTLKFSSVWERVKDHTDIVLCLGDRFEMHAALLASIPFNIKIAHLHGGETSLGAIDNYFRHSISLMSKYHFTATEKAASKVSEMLGSDEHVYHVGALSLDKLQDIPLLDPETFEKTYQIPLSEETLLLTFHPETVGGVDNGDSAEVIAHALMGVTHPVIITMPNADFEGQKIKKVFLELTDKRPDTYLVDSLGAVGYFSAMKYCKCVIGNSSSGIIEAASFNKYVINIGERQKSREHGDNVIHCPVSKKAILDALESVNMRGAYQGDNLYGCGGTSDKIINILKSIVA
ncbi:UDP-N-acetylglucosamine 2-epimerase [Cytophagaceae bacterium ABcell3]|nr:UDP-N-acetylglucosamine 2-epimerase [Cytophagaceae bacterium ABcell3]